MTAAERIGSSFAIQSREKVRDRLAFFEPQTLPRTASLSMRLPMDLKKSVQELQAVWTEIERVRTGDPGAQVSEADAWIRLCTIAAAGAWEELGGRKARTEDEVHALAVKAAESMGLLPKK